MRCGYVSRSLAVLAQLMEGFWLSGSAKCQRGDRRLVYLSIIPALVAFMRHHAQGGDLSARMP